MKTRIYFFPLFLLLLFVVSGHAYGADKDIESKLAASLMGGRYLRMANNFFIIYDPSTSMDVPYKDTGLSMMEAEKQILMQSNATLPDLGWQAGLYPHWKGGLWLHGTVMAFNPYYDLRRYDQETYGQAIDKLPVRPTGPPMLQRGLMKLDLLLGLPGRTEVFIFSDGKHSTYKGLEEHPLKLAKMLNEKYDVCFTIVSSATTGDGIQLLNDIASVNSCSQVIDFDTVFDKPEHLFGKLYMDTEALGFDNVLFDFDKSNIKKQYKPILDKLGHFLLDQPRTYAVLSGFCDSKGTEAYNIKLSRKRAEKVRNYLVKNFKIPNDRILTYWYGYANPVASNATADGRALNRRVTVAIRLGK